MRSASRVGGLWLYAQYQSTSVAGRELVPDLKNFVITPLAAANINMPRATISCQVVHSVTGAVLADFTGANVLTFPADLQVLTAAQRLELVQMIATWWLQKAAPAAWG
jgi:hypothetical protein